LPVHLREVERPGNRGGYKVGIADRGQVDEDDAVGKD
jgi:hypothetical protein